MTRTKTRTRIARYLMLIAMLTLGLLVATAGNVTASPPLQSQISDLDVARAALSTPTPQGGAAVSISPYLTSKTSVTICGTVIPALSNLRVDVTETTATLQFETCASIRTTVILHADVNPAPFADGQLFDDAAGTHHTLTFTGFPAGKSYAYHVVEVNGGELANGHFQTALPRVTGIQIKQADAGALEMTFSTSAPCEAVVLLTALGPPDEAPIPPITLTFAGIQNQFWLRQPNLHAHAQYAWAIQVAGKTIAGDIFNT